MAKRKIVHRHKKYYQILSPLHHLERKIETLDKENDRLQQRVLMLSLISVLLAVTGILLALLKNN
ncbi:MAG: hypothetical protein M3Q36_00115 [bacterium]|nr:hypothetical protein [bacterium]